MGLQPRMGGGWGESTSRRSRKSKGVVSQSGASGDYVPTSPEDEVIELGCSTVVHMAGVQAYRVPFEDFAALAEPGGSCPLQLIVDAVSACTHGRQDRGAEGYAVFGST